MEKLSDLGYNYFLREKYQLHFDNKHTDRKYLLLLQAIGSWDNRSGAVNAFTEAQLANMLDRLTCVSKDPLVKYQPPVTGGTCGVGGTTAGLGYAAGLSGSLSGITLGILNTRSINLTLVNDTLSANTNVSNVSGNALTVLTDGLYVTQASTGTSKFIRSDAFTTSTQYNDVSLKDKQFVVTYRGYGELYYNWANPSDPLNEFQLVGTGGFNITIPGFDVTLDPNNTFHILIL
ncbi:MAG: hypothetical protein HYU71_06395 [Bacteroidetes bacterium]|nr:hypothetical protein [Bacteroidota bacterium]